MSCRDQPSASSMLAQSWISAPPGNSLSDVAGGQNPLISSGTRHDNIDLISVIHDNESGSNGRSAVREVDGERAGAIRIHRIGPASCRVGEIGNDHAVDRDSIGLSKTTISIEVGHSYANLRANRSGASQLLSSDRESIIAGKQSVGAGWEILLGQCRWR